MKLLTAILATTVLALPASAATLRITVTNNQDAPIAGPDGFSGDAGFALTPVYGAFHDGSFDTVTLGEEVSAGVETLAELGSPAAVRAEREAAHPGSTGTVIANGRPIFGGESASAEVEITDFENQRYFSFLSMIIPSNDLFIANADAQAFNLFNDDGSFAGPRIINVSGLQVFDAGTEENNADVTGGAAFIAGSSAPAGVDTDGVASAGFSALEEFLGVDTVAGFNINSELAPSSFFADANNASFFNVATITIEQVAPVPLPAGGALLLSGLAFGGFAARRKSKRA